MEHAAYVRFEGTVRHARGHFPGVFVLANELAASGQLSNDQYWFWRASNDWYDANYTNPTTVDPKIYDPAVHPGAVAWFKASATHLIERVDGYLALLSAHGLACRRLASSDPGEIVYEDEDQIVVVPVRDAATE
ncbi:hypothetical protein [Streptomyces sp. SGAir0957]